jgi:hypothetical protein
MLRIRCSDLQDPRDPKVLVSLHVALGSVLASHVHKMIILVDFALNYQSIISNPLAAYEDRATH